MSRPPSGPSPGRTRRLSLIHRTAGVTAGGVLLYLLATGLPLQFSHELNLGSRTATSSFVLDWYGLQAPDEVLISNGVVAVGSVLYWSGDRVGTADVAVEDARNDFLGAVRLDELVVAATRDALVIFPATNPGLAERQPAGEPVGGPVGEPVGGIAVLDGRVHVRSGDQVRRFDRAMLNSEPVATPVDAIPWAQPRAADSDVTARHQQLFRARMLSLERIFQDLHSGRFFGPIGVWVVNLATLLLLALAVSGYLIWWRSRGA